MRSWDFFNTFSKSIGDATRRAKMTDQFMRRMDDSLGVPLCLPFSLPAAMRRFLCLRAGRNSDPHRPLAEGLVDIQTVLSIRSDGLAHFGVDVARVPFALWRERCDATFDLEFFAKFTARLRFLAGRRRVGFHSRPAGVCCSRTRSPSTVSGTLARTSWPCWSPLELTIARPRRAFGAFARRVFDSHPAA